MKTVVVAIFAVILVGCSPQKRLARLLDRYPIKPDTVTEIIPGEIVYRDTTIYDTIPGEIVYDTDTLLLLGEVELPEGHVYAETDLAWAHAWWEQDRQEDRVRLELELKQKDSIYQFKLDSALREQIPDTVKTIIKEPYPVIEKTSSFWKHGFLVLASLILLIVILWFVLRKR